MDKKIKLLRPNNSKAKCDECKHLVRISVTFYKGKYLCSKCRRKTKGCKIQQSLVELGHPRISLEQALNKIYKVKFYVSSKNTKSAAVISVPRILAGRYVKLVLVEKT